MAISKMMQHQLEEILRAGGSIEIDANGRMTHHLTDLAKCAKHGGAQLIITGVANLLHHNLLEIATAGKGFVTFRD